MAIELQTVAEFNFDEMVLPDGFGRVLVYEGCSSPANRARGYVASFSTCSSRHAFAFVSLASPKTINRAASESKAQIFPAD